MSDLPKLNDGTTWSSVLSQLNRESRKGKPHMEHLKYASTIENEAHVITFLHREEGAQAVNGVMQTEWYSDKTRVQKSVYSKLAFHPTMAEYTGLMGYGVVDDSQYNYDQQAGG